MDLPTEESSIADGKANVDTSRKQSEFSTTIGTYVTLIGYASGMSDFWRFPFLVYRNGGGAFLIPFILTTCICGIPLFFLEYTLSNFSGKGPYRIWDISPLFRGMGIAMMVACTIYVIGGSVFRGWLIYFFVNSFQNPLPWTHCNNTWNTDTCKTNPFVHYKHPEITQNMTSYDVTGNSTNTLEVAGVANSTGMTAAEEYWQFDALRLSSGLDDFQSFHWRVALCITAFRVLVFLAMIKSIKSIEKVMFFTTFVQFAFMIIVFGRSLTLDGAVEGLSRFFKPDFSMLSRPRIWIEAFLMSFYTMSFGWGVNIMMGSHAKFKDKSLRTSIAVPVVDSMVAIFTGMICFVVLGNMAAAYGVHIDQVFSAGMSVGVVSYITALSSLPIPQFWTAGFLFSVVMTGIDTQVIVVEMCLEVIGELFPGLFPKHRFLTFVLYTMSLLIFTLPTATGAGAYIFLWIDWYAGAWSGAICAFLEVIIVAWIYGIDRFNTDIEIMIGRPIPAAIRIILAFITPCLVLVIFVISILEYVPPHYGTYIYPGWARGLGWLTVAVIMMPIPVVAIKCVVTESGSLVKKIRKTLHSNSQWGPKEDSVIKEYQEKQKKFQHRTLKDILHFAIFGHYKEKDDFSNQTELSHMQ